LRFFYKNKEKSKKKHIVVGFLLMIYEQFIQDYFNARI